MNESVAYPSPAKAPALAPEEAEATNGSLKSRLLRRVKSSKDERKLEHVAWLLVIGMFSMKLSVTPVRGTALELVLVVLYAALGVMLMKRMVEIKPLSFISMLVFLAAMTAAAMATDSKSTSVFYVYLNYIPFLFCIRLTPRNYMRFLNIHQIFMASIATLVFTGWIFQFFNKPMPDMEHYIPNGLRFFNFNYIQPLEWGNKFVKPNAFIYLETSYVAQAMATAFIVEFCLFRRTLWMAVFISALTVSFGGTGYGLLLLSIPILLFYARGKTVTLSLALAPIALFLAFSLGVTDNIQSRLDGFDRQNSSSDQRFNAQWREIEKSFSDPLVMLRGVGAGNTLQDTNIVWIPPVKVAVEYGFIVGIAFVVLIIYSATSAGTPFALAYPMVVQFMLFNGGFLVPISIFYLLLMTCMVKPTQSLAQLQHDKPPAKDPRRSRGLRGDTMFGKARIR